MSSNSLIFTDTSEAIKTLRELPGLGEKSVAMLAQAGINNLSELRTLGAVAAYWRVKQSQTNVSLNLLWALEGALSGLHWQVVAQQQRLSLLLELEQLQKGGLKQSGKTVS